MKHINKDSTCLFLKYMASISKFGMYLHATLALLQLTPVVYHISSIKTCSCDLIFENILNVCISNKNRWIAIIKFWGHHASKFGILFRNGGHIGFNYTHTSLMESFVYLYLLKPWQGVWDFRIVIIYDNYLKFSCTKEFGQWHSSNFG